MANKLRVNPERRRERIHIVKYGLEPETKLTVRRCSKACLLLSSVVSKSIHSANTAEHDYQDRAGPYPITPYRLV